jgi:hypothetical protein
MTKNLILEALFNNPIIDDMIWNITGGHPLKDDLKSELFLILMEMSETKIILAWEGKWLNYLCVNILTKQWKSGTSPFHKKFKKFKWEDGEIELVEEVGLDVELLEKGQHSTQQSWICENCRKSGKGLSNYSRWHGKNCRSTDQ